MGSQQEEARTAQEGCEYIAVQKGIRTPTFRFVEQCRSKEVNKLRRNVVNVDAPVLRRCLEVELPIGKLNLAIRRVLQLVNNAEHELELRNRLQDSLLNHVILADLLVFHLVLQGLKVQASVVSEPTLPTVVEAAVLRLLVRR